MLYLVPPSGPDVIAAMHAGLIGCMTTPAQGNVLPDGVPCVMDNGKFGEGWYGSKKWFEWVEGNVERYGAARFLFCVAPDVPFDAEATLEESLPWLPKIRAFGLRVAFVAQNGAEVHNGLVPWGEFDVLFLGGGPECLHCDYVRPPKAFQIRHCPHCGKGLTEWKTSLAARLLTREARLRGLDNHMGRVNGGDRLLWATVEAGCATADGTGTTRAPRIVLREVRRWLRAIEDRRGQVGLVTTDDVRTATTADPAPWWAELQARGLLHTSPPVTAPAAESVQPSLFDLDVPA